MNKHRFRYAAWEYYLVSALLYVYPLAVLAINSLNGLTVPMALREVSRQFFTLGPGLVNWGLVLVLDCLIGLYAAPVILVHKLKLKGLQPSAAQVGHAMKHLNNLPKKLVGLTVVLFFVAALLRVLLAELGKNNPGGLGLHDALFVNLGEALVSGYLVGVILAINFDNTLFRVRSTIVGLDSGVRMCYNPMYSKVFMALFAIVAYVLFTTFATMGSFFSLGMRNPELMPDPAMVIITGPQLMLQGQKFQGLREAANVFGLKTILVGAIVLHVLWQLKQMFSQPIRTVHRHLRILNGPDAARASAIDILQNDEFAPIYREINELIARQQNRLDLSEKRLLAVIHDAPDPIVVFDRDRIIRLFNPAAEKAFEYPAVEITGRHLDMLLPGSGLDLLAAHVDGVAQLEWSCQHGRRILMESHISEAALGSDDWVIAILRDITAQAELEASLKRARQEAETASRMKSEFLANMSHELRTPLNAILGFTQLLSGDKNLTEAQRDRIRIISRSGEHLLSLINDILDISKIEAGKMELHAGVFDLHEFVQDLRDMFGLKCQAKGLTLYVDTLENLPRHVEGDLGKLRQVMINLLGNAVKFTEEGGVSILVGKQDGRIRFAVQDSGRGIPLDEQEKILQPFVQASTSDHEGGTGLGLAISSHYIALMGGRLELVSSPGQGSTFAFSLDLPEAQSAVIPSVGEDVLIAVDPELALTVLVVDDQLTNRLVLKEMLERVGFQIQEAKNGQEAVEFAREFKPVLVFMDIKMPVLDGYGAVAKLKADPLTAAIPVFALTASAFTHDEKKIRSAGFDGFLAKPFKTGQLYRLILDAGAVPVRVVSDVVAAAELNAGEVPDPQALDPARLRALLGPEGLAELGDCVSIGDYGGLGALADRYAAAWPELGRLLAVAARNFDENLIGRLLSRLEEKA